MKKLLAISMLILLVKFSFSQMLYTDLEPDVDFHQNNGWENYFTLDLNNDGIDDLEFTREVTPDVLTFRVRFYSEFAFISTSNYGIYLFENMDLIDSNIVYYNNLEVFTDIPLCDNVSYDCWSETDWCVLSKKYIGLKFENDGNVYYGWILIKDFHTIDSYAINTIPDEFIFAGQGQKVNVSDRTDYQDGRDLAISFGYPYNENIFDEYRILVVKSENAENFDLQTANNVSSENYYSIIPNNTIQNFKLTENSKDVDGDIITDLIPYKVFLLSIARSGISEENVLSKPSDEITLKSHCQSVVINNFTSEFINGGNYNINVNFDYQENVSSISEFRIMFVKSSDAVILNIDSLNLIGPDNYYQVTPQGNTYNINLTKNEITDIYGNPITKTDNYKVAILTVANNFETNVNAYSISENYLKFQTPANKISNIYVMDVANKNLISDLQFTFNKISDNRNVSEYRLIFSESKKTLNLETCENLPSSAYYVILPQNINNITRPTKNFTDAQGNLFSIDKEYLAYILSVSDGYYSDFNSLSGYSNTFALHNPNYIYNGYIGDNMTFVDIEPDVEVFLSNIESENKLSIDIFSSKFDIRAYQFFSSYELYKIITRTSISAINGEINYERDSLDVIYFNGCCFSFNLFSTDESAGECEEPYHIPYNQPFFQGLKILDGTDIHYGWIKLELKTFTNLKIYEYAYTTSPFGQVPEDTTTIVPEAKFKIYPNPAKNTLNLFLNNNIVDYYYIEIYNTKGIKVYVNKYRITNYYETIEQDISFLPSGIYVIKITNSNGVSVNRFEKLK